MSAATVVESEYLTLTQAAARAGRCEDTIRQWLHRQRLTRYRLMGRLVIRATELDAILQARDAATESPVSEPAPSP